MSIILLADRQQHLQMPKAVPTCAKAAGSGSQIAAAPTAQQRTLAARIPAASS